MTREDEIWLAQQIAKDRLEHDRPGGYGWLLVSIVGAWLALSVVIALVIRLVEVIRA